MITTATPAPRPIKTYPRLVRLDGSGHIILVKNRTTGTIIHSDDEMVIAFVYDNENFDDSRWEDYGGTVTLSN